MDEREQIQIQRERLLQLICAAEGLTGATVAINDVSGFLRRVGAMNAGDLPRLRHGCAFCKAQREAPGGRALCIRNDLELRAAIAMEQKAPFWQRCHGGLWEYVVPLLAKERLVALFSIGQVQVTGRAELKGPGTLPPVAAEKMEQAGMLLHAALQSWAAAYPETLLERELSRRGRSVVMQALDLVTNRLEQGIDAAQVAKALYITPSALNRAFQRECGLTLHAYIENSRYELACRLLRETSQSVSALALNVGFSQDMDFSRWFRRRSGMSPTAWRRQKTPALPGVTLPEHSQKRAWAEEAKAYLEAHFREKVTVSGLARGLHITPDHLERCFHREVGCSITAYLTALRLAAAEELLGEGTVSMAQAARSCGFSSAAALKQKLTYKKGHASFKVSQNEVVFPTEVVYKEIRKESRSLC